MGKSDEEIKFEAITFARKNKKDIARRFLASKSISKIKSRVALFMAGSPGAGKTETAKEFIETIAGDVLGIPRIDADDLRAEFAEYDGTNSHLFQAAASVLVDKVIDIAIDKELSFVLDGTLAKYSKAEANIQRCLRHGYKVVVVYVYQDPIYAWKFVCAREQIDGRSVPVGDFIDKFFEAPVTVNALKKKFDTEIAVYQVQKGEQGDTISVGTIDSIDLTLHQTYDKNTLRKKINHEI